jgi:diguanylate cyclase (GGDEF)-like protein
LLGLVIVVLMGAADYASGPDLSFLIFYILPVSFVGWHAGRLPSLLIAGLSAVAWYYADALTVPAAPHPLVSMWNVAMKAGFLLVVALATAALREAYDTQKKLARTDPLTGVSNRRAFLDRLGQEVRRSCRYQRPLSLAYFDVDNFKTVNDLYGHAEGDRLLRTVAVSLRGSIRESDCLGRLGGDEFALLLPETGSDTVQATLDKCRRVLAETVTRGGWPVTFSFGAVTSICPVESAETLLRKADALLLEAKRTGKDRLCHETIDVRPAPDPS